MRFGLQLCCHFMQVLTNWSELGSQQLLRFLVRNYTSLWHSEGCHRPAVPYQPLQFESCDPCSLPVSACMNLESAGPLVKTMKARFIPSVLVRFTTHAFSQPIKSAYRFDEVNFLQQARGSVSVSSAKGPGLELYSRLHPVSKARSASCRARLPPSTFRSASACLACSALPCDTRRKTGADTKERCRHERKKTSRERRQAPTDAGRRR